MTQLLFPPAYSRVLWVKTLCFSLRTGTIIFTEEKKKRYILFVILCSYRFLKSQAECYCQFYCLFSFFLLGKNAFQYSDGKDKQSTQTSQPLCIVAIPFKILCDGFVIFPFVDFSMNLKITYFECYGNCSEQSIDWYLCS